MEKRAIIAFVASLVVLLGWELFFSPPKPVQQPPAQQQQQQQQAPAPAAPEAAKALPQAVPGTLPQGAPAEAPAVAKTWTVDTPRYTATVADAGARMKFFRLKDYHQTVSKTSPPMDVVTTGGGGYLPLAVDLLQRPAWNLSTRPYASATPEKIALDRGGKPGTLALTTEIPGEARVTKTLVFAPESFMMGLTVTIENLSEKPLVDQLSLSDYTIPYGATPAEQSFNPTRAAYLQKTSLSKIDLSDMAKKTEAIPGPIEWAGFENSHFLNAVIPPADTGVSLYPRQVDPATNLVRLVLVTDPFEVAPRQSKSFAFSVFMGPKETDQLKAAGHGLDESLDYGWFGVIAGPLLAFLKWLYGYVHNYGVAIIILTILIKIVFWPLTQKSYKSMQNMKKLQPKMAQLREKYKDDRQKMNEELMRLYRTYKVNPLGGCLPMLLQIPVFFALYRMLYTAVDLLHQPFMLWMNDLTAPDRLPVGFEIPYVGNGLPVLTILMGVSMFVQQKMTPSTGDPRQEKMMLFMPVVFTVFFINFPAGLVLYWLVNNILSIAQQWWINRQPSKV